MTTINTLARSKGQKARVGTSGPFAASRNVEARALLLVSVSLLVGLWLVYQVKSRRPLDFSALTENTQGAGLTLTAEDGRSPTRLLNLNRVERPDEIVPYLTEFDTGEERAFAARKLIAERPLKKGFQHVGALGGIRVVEKDLGSLTGLDELRKRLDEAKIAAAERRAQQERLRGFDPVRRLRELLHKLFSKGAEEADSVALVQQVGAAKSVFVVRTPAEFRHTFLTSAALLLLSVWGLHLYWRVRRFGGDQIILPNIFALCALGFLMMTSLRDPLRDTLSFVGFASGVFIGCVVVALLTSFDYYRLYYALRSRVARADSYITAAPIATALFLSVLLVLLGNGPSGSDKALVNLDLGPLPQFQPSEIIRLLVVFFIAGYFGRRWELVQNLNEPHFKPVSLPRVKDVWAVCACVAAVLLFFVIQKDLGPALLMAGLFLLLFTIVRGRPWLSLVGFAAIVGVYLFNYFVFRFSPTAAARLDIWMSPWDTMVSGGEQIVHSLWALAAGGVTGTGLGLGDPRLVPAGHTDLILSSLGEEFGFLGLLLVSALYATLLHRCFRAALRAPSVYTYLLAVGVAIISGLQVLFIGAAILGLIPLSGVVTPFMSYGSSSLVMNFAAFGVVLVISAHGGAPAPDVERSFARPTRYVTRAFALLALVVMAKAALVQVVQADEITLRSVLAPRGEEVSSAGGKYAPVIRPRQYISNPRLAEVMKELPYGTIYDRNEIPLASSKWEVLEAKRAKYKELGIDLDKVCRKGRRCYPFGPTTFFLLGDVRTRKNWGGDNFFIEKEYEAWLRGFDDHESFPWVKVKQLTPQLDAQTDEPVINEATGQPEWNETLIERRVVKRDYRELLPLLRARYTPNNFAAERLRHNARDVFTSIDVELQVHLTQIVADELRAGKLKHGAAVVLEPRSGDLLASVSYPYPSADDDNAAGSNESRDAANGAASVQDRARFGGEAPGSTFKIVTAMAAARAAEAKSGTFGWKNLCEPVAEMRNGVLVRGNGVKVRGKVFMDHDKDKPPHGMIEFERAFFESCNAYFVQLGVDVAEAKALYETAKLFDIKVSSPPGVKDTPTPQDFTRRLDTLLPQASIGQGEVRTNVFEMAKVAATVANRGTMPYGRWVKGEGNLRNNPPLTDVISPAAAEAIANAMLKVTTDEKGTAFRVFVGSHVQVAGKTGTAQDTPLNPHSWFVGFAPFGGPNQIAFAVFAENGGSGAGVAARISKRLVEEAGKRGLY